MFLDGKSRDGADDNVESEVVQPLEADATVTETERLRA